ncbi:MAG TPA: response regulator [Candidatus Dormibacteraeota bacterium]
MILVVDDNEFNLALTCAVLERAGYEVEAVRSGEAAVACISERRPELVLMDVQLPGRDGLELTRDLKSEPTTADIPIVALTAHAMRGDDEQALAAGCSGYITKPIDTRTFASEVGRFLK